MFAENAEVNWKGTAFCVWLWCNLALGMTQGNNF